MKISGEIVEENAMVVWLQVDKWFADIRTFPQSTQAGYAFAGTITWEDPRLNFHHRINTRGIDENDSADFEFNDSFCIERGQLLVNDISRDFEETWSIEKITVPCKASLRYDGSKIRSVRVDHERESIAVEEDSAVHVCMTSGSPKLISSVGPTERVRSLLNSFLEPCWEVVEKRDANY